MKLLERLLGSSHGVFSCAVSSVEIRKPCVIYISLIFAWIGLPLSPLLEVSDRIIEATASGGTQHTLDVVHCIDGKRERPCFSFENGRTAAGGNDRRDGQVWKAGVGGGV